jgi:hypothetical protein
MSTDCTYSEIVMGVLEPDAMIGPAWLMRDMGMDIPAYIPDGQCLIVTSVGWEVMQ